jgi:hypothetical protein
VLLKNAEFLVRIVANSLVDGVPKTNSNNIGMLVGARQPRPYKTALLPLFDVFFGSP